jgi:hypothetical protein
MVFSILIINCYNYSDVENGDDIYKANDCEYKTESIDGKISQNLLDAYEVDDGLRVVIIVMKEDVPWDEPLPDCRTCPEKTRIWNEREAKIAALQECIIEKIEDIGGVYIQNFVLGNYLSAELNKNQAFVIAADTEVRQIEDGQGGSPPP